MIYSCKIEPGRVFLNGEEQNVSFSGERDWKKELYNELMEYPKFYKMDALSKMAILALTFLQRSVDFSQFSDDGISLIFANSNSSGATDNKFISSYTESGNPSPSLFVYTLPNIVTGELSIKNKWYGENIFLINDVFSPELYLEQINFNFNKGAESCLCAWVDDREKHEECILFLVTNDGKTIKEEELTTIYTQ